MKDNVFELQNSNSPPVLSPNLAKANRMPQAPKVKNTNQYIQVEVFTQRKEDCTWGIFDFGNVKIDGKTGQVIDKKKKNEDDEDSDPRNKGGNYVYDSFRMKGTSYVTRQSKYQMT